MYTIDLRASLVGEEGEGIGGFLVGILGENTLL